jgi:Mechanosensitive ion channel, conserved TM helix
MLAIDIQGGLSDAWARIAVFVPKLLGFLAILIIGYFVAKLLARVVDGLLERVGFDRWVERGAVKQALDRSSMDASDILAIVTFWAVFLIVLQLAFGVFGPNPVSALIQGIIAFLPNIFVALVIIVITSALAKVVTEIVRATIGTMAGGDLMARAAGAAILVVGVFAALNQLQIAPAIVTGLFYALLAVIVGSAVVALGGGGIPVARRYLERASTKLEEKGPEMRQASQGADERIQERAQSMRDELSTS